MWTALDGLVDRGIMSLIGWILYPQTFPALFYVIIQVIGVVMWDSQMVIQITARIMMMWMLDVHGGLTYAGKCNGAICHIPAPGMPDNVWWLGFDCAHGFDLIPRMMDEPVLNVLEGLSFTNDIADYRDVE